MKLKVSRLSPFFFCHFSSFLALGYNKKEGRKEGRKYTVTNYKKNYKCIKEEEEEEKNVWMCLVDVAYGLQMKTVGSLSVHRREAIAHRQYPPPPPRIAHRYR